ncbi:MAG: sodium:proton antiporter [Desulfurococcaceae archaeon]
MVFTIIIDTFKVIYITTIATGFIFSILLLLFYVLKSNRTRITSVYLSGEGENVVSHITPSVGSLYWGFIKRFAKTLYRSLVEKVHTGSLHDWFKFISSWFSILLLLAIIVFMLTLYLR